MHVLLLWKRRSDGNSGLWCIFDGKEREVDFGTSSSGNYRMKYYWDWKWYLIWRDKLNDVSLGGKTK